MADLEHCLHKTIFEGVCSECGLEVEGTYIDMTSSYSEFHSHTDTVTVQPFENDLKHLSIPDDVKNLVVTLALSCPKDTHRMGVRKQQLFAYIYLAYLQLGYKFDPDNIIEELKMTKREINMSLRVISGTSSSDISLPAGERAGEVLTAPVVVITPVDFIEDICKSNNLSPQLDEITNHAKKILEKNKILYEFNPKHIAIALIKHFLIQSKITIPKFAKANGISESILKQHMNRITC
jgi:hypothetical protein